MAESGESIEDLMRKAPHELTPAEAGSVLRAMMAGDRGGGDDRGLVGNPAYECYARVNGLSSAEQVQHDREANPDDLRAPYVAWKDVLLDTFAKLHPEHVDGTVVDGDFFNDWLLGEWEPSQSSGPRTP